MLVGGGRENQQYFMYADRERSFRFVASRALSEVPGNTDDLSDEWQVLLDAGLNQLDTNKTPTFLEAREIADNIKDGLLAWGWYEGSERTSARSVKFLMKTWHRWSPALGWED
jgi:hypothetical protein